MKRRLCNLIVALLASVSWTTLAGGREDLASDFEAANKLYEQGKFPEAASAYQKLAGSAPASAAIYYNLGNACFKSGEIGRALAAYRQAERIAPRDPDVRANLQFVRNQVQGPTIPPTRWERWIGRLTVNEWTGLASAALWLWLLLLALTQLRPALKQTLRGTVWLSGIAVMILAMCVATALSEASTTSAIVAVRDTAVRNGPIEESPPAFTAHDGAELRVLDRKDDWLQVSAGNRFVGWLKREQVVVVPEDHTRAD